MRVFVDTSALYALLDEDDTKHATAVSLFTDLKGAELVTHGYVLVETLALVSRRLGWDQVIRLLDGILPVVSVRPVDSETHQAALRVYREAAAGSVGFVDRTSFEFMRAGKLTQAFAFDSDFEAAGFELVG